MNVSISSLQAAAGRFLTSSGPMAWESESRQRLEALVGQFQAKQLGSAGLEAALAGERGALPALARSKTTTALLQLSGVLMPNESIFSLLGFGTSVRGFMRELTAAGVDRAVKAIAIVVDSPGGSIRMLPEAAALMRATRRLKPVVVSVAGMNASGAYWLTAGASAIEATPSASIGAIGVVTQRASIVKLLEREGVDIEVFSAGKFKAEGHEATKVTDVERKAKQAEVNAAYREFVNSIVLGRYTPAASIIGGYGEGRLVSAADALQLGMIDGIGLVEDTVNRVVSAPGQLAALCAQRLKVFADRIEVISRAKASDEITEHRRALVAAVRRSPTDSTAA